MEKGDTLPKHDSLVSLGKIFGVNTTYLMHGKKTDNQNNESSYISPNERIPLLSWQQANQQDPLKNLTTDHKEWLAPHPNMIKHCYALTVVGESMLPEFRPHDKIYITTDIQHHNLKTGDFVIIQHKENNDALFKRLIIETDGYFLQALNEKWPQQTIQLTASFKIVGKVVGLWRNIA